MGVIVLALMEVMGMQTGMLISSDGMVLVVMTVLLEQKLCIVVEVMMMVRGGWSSSDAHRKSRHVRAPTTSSSYLLQPLSKPAG